MDYDVTFVACEMIIPVLTGYNQKFTGINNLICEKCAVIIHRTGLQRSVRAEISESCWKQDWPDLNLFLRVKGSNKEPSLQSVVRRIINPGHSSRAWKFASQLLGWKPVNQEGSDVITQNCACASLPGFFAEPLRSKSRVCLSKNCATARKKVYNFTFHTITINRSVATGGGVFGG